jgi:F-type H+-transporting ATPase subunit delta
MTGAVGRRYARALFALAKEAGVLEPTATHLTALAAVGADATVGPVLRSPVLSAQHRSELVQLLGRELHLPDLLMRFTGVLAEHNRLSQLPAIADVFRQLLDAELGRVRITIQSARPLDAPDEQRIIATFATLTGQLIIPTAVVDPELLGGIVVEVADTVYDGSVRNQLERLAKELTGISTP